MTYQEILANARTCMGPYCKSCPVCNGVACKNTVPGPGAKGLGTGFIRNYQKWQELCVNMDTICENVPVDTGYDFFGNYLFGNYYTFFGGSLFYNGFCSRSLFSHGHCGCSEKEHGHKRQH